jgi:hypothetical integral membrane protein (TIGR02206 family)
MVGLARFGEEHWTLLLASIAAAAAAGLLGRALRGRPDPAASAGRCLAYVIVAALLAAPLVHHSRGDLTLATGLPLELCDAAAIASALALLRRGQLLFELGYFWGLGGATQALLTPPTDPALAGTNAWCYTIAHAATIAAVVYLGPGLGLRPRRGSWQRTSLVTIGYAIAVGLVDWAVGANYMWLRTKPPGSVLELFGPWPWYILGGAAIGATIFFLLELPYRADEGRGGAGG